MAKKSVKVPGKHKPIYYTKKDILGRAITKTKPSVGQKQMLKNFSDMAKRKGKKMAGWKAIKSKISK